MSTTMHVLKYLISRLARLSSVQLSCWAIMVVMVMVTPIAVQAQQAAPEQQTTQEAAAEVPLNVGLYVNPPFVMNVDGSFSGMGIDLWEGLAADLNLSYEYQLFDSVSDMLQATRDGEIDVAVSNLSITSARAEDLEFTQPWFDAGMRIMVNEEEEVGLGQFFEGLADAGLLKAYAWLAGVIIVATLLLTLFDRQFNKNFPKTWTDGTAESFYTVMSVATSGRMPSRPNLFGWIGRFMQALWLICGIAVLAYVTSSVTSVMTVLALNNQIANLDDLPGKHVGVRAGTTAEEFSRQEGFDVFPYPDMDTLVEALLDHEIDAIVGDAPVLEYYAVSNPALPLDVVGPIFSPEKYGFALPRDSQLDRDLTIEILDDLEAERVEEIRQRYFGDDP